MTKEKTESLFWADQIAREVKKRVEINPELKKIVKKEGYIVYDEKTPSGNIHIGAGRGWIIHDTLAKAMRDIGLKARFILSSDDIDPYDKPNKDLKDFDKYLGMPFMDIPSPVEGYKSFADYYFTQATDKFKEMGIDAELESTGERYKKGDFNKTIKLALDNSDKIKKIFEDMYDKPYDKLPFHPICEKCGKIGTTKAIKWENEKVYYECQEDLVDWAKGCNHKAWISPYNGNGKLPWKVEWAAKWPTVGVVCELAGKDHFSAGGSRDVSIRISDKVFDFPPPYPSTRTKIGKAYEFFNIGGKKMSTSKGRGIPFAETTNFIPAKMLRYLLVSSRPTAVVDFDPFRPNDIILLYERYDKTERIYFKQQKVEEKEYQQHKRIYELAHIGKIPKKMPIQISLSYASMAIQIGLNEQGALEILQKNKQLPKDASDEEVKNVLERINEAELWLEKFATDDYKFEIQKQIPEDLNLTNKQKSALNEIAKILDKDWEEKALYEEFYNICKKMDILPKELFQAGYKVLLNKERGPKLAGFILTIGKDKVKMMFEKV